jgi:hypothetical protein
MVSGFSMFCAFSVHAITASELHSSSGVDVGSVAGKGVAGKDAWVFLASRCPDLVQALSSARTLRMHGTSADIVVMLFGELADQEIVEQGFGPLLANLSVRALSTTIPLEPLEVTNEKTRSLIDESKKWWDFVKVRTWELHPYERIVFLDGDVYFVKNMDSSFDNPECTRVAGAASPFNAGWFRVDPSQAKFDELMNIVRTEEFDKISGWANQCSSTKPDVTKGRLCTHDRKTGKKFHRVAGGESTQGLFAYYCDVVKDINMNIMFHSFEYKNAPYGCLKKTDGACRRIDEGLQAIHATGNCGKHPNACECPELYARWWEAHEMNIPFYTSPEAKKALKMYPYKLGCLSPTGKPIDYFEKKCKRRLIRHRPEADRVEPCTPWTKNDFDHPENHDLGGFVETACKSPEETKSHHKHHKHHKHHHDHRADNPEHGKQATAALIKSV